MNSATTTVHAPVPVPLGWRRSGLKWPAMAAVLSAHVAVMLSLIYLSNRAPPQTPSQAPVTVSFMMVDAPRPKPRVEEPPPPPRKIEPVTPTKPVLIAAPRPEPVAVQAPMVEEPPPPETASPEPAPAPPAPLIPPNFVAAYLNNPSPSYPAASKRMGETGKVLLRVVVSPLGTADSVEIHKSSGYDRLDKAALEAVRRWKFVPARQGDSAIAAAVIVPIDFQLRE